MSGHLPWSAAEDATLRTLHRQRKTCAQISAKIPGRTARAVASRASALRLIHGVSPRAWTPAQDALFTDLTKSDEEIAVAASKVGPPRTTIAVKGRRKALGIHRARPPVPARTTESDDPRGWPGLYGSHEARDAAFVRRLLVAAQDEGLLPRVAA